MLCETLDANLESAYVMGHRLETFLSIALPQHPEYERPKLARKRAQAERDLKWIRVQLQDIACAIDEIQLNNYMDRQYDPAADDVSSCSGSSSASDSPSCEGKGPLSGGESTWEAFTGWSTDKSPGLAETDTSNSDVRESDEEEDIKDTTFGEPVEFLFDIEPPMIHNDDIDDTHDNDEDSFPNPEDYPDPELPEPSQLFPDPDLNMALTDEDIDEDDEGDGDVHEHDVLNLRCALNEPILATPFLKKIATQDVCYEDDSDACDSWEQDEEENSVDLSNSSGSLLTCDPARIAFREIMNRIPRNQVVSSRIDVSPSRRRLRAMRNNPATVEM